MRPANRQKSLPAMAATYCLGVFNDNYFKQAAMLLAVAAGANQLQGWAAILFALPFILFSAHGGWCADRFAKKRVVVMAKGLEVLAMMVGAVGLITGSWACILMMVFVMGLQSTFFSPSLNGSIPELYPAESVPRINAIIKLATTVAILAGIAIAGISLDQNWMDTDAAPFGVLLVAVTSVLVAVTGLVASFGIHKYKGATENSEVPFPWFGPYRSVKDLIDICRDRQLLVAVAGDAWFYFIASIAVLVINAVGIQQFGFSQTMTSLLSVSLMLGVCAGSFLAARLTRVDNWSAYLVPAVLGIAIGLIMAGMTTSVPESARFWWLMFALGFAGIAGGLFLIPITSFLQIRPADSDKGRVLAAAGFTAFVAILLSGMLYNIFESLLAPTAFMLALGVLSVLMVFVFQRLVASTGSTPRSFVGTVLRTMLCLRYKITVQGREELVKAAEHGGDRPQPGTIFLPNHPALIDPVIVMSILHDRFAPRPLSDEAQLRKPLTKHAMRFIDPIALPDIKTNGRGSREAVHQAINEVVASLKRGENVLFYPAGRLNRGPLEDLGANSGLEFILRNVPGVQVVLVRTTGLWGSSFSRASGKSPALVKHLKRYLTALLANGLFFGPKREVRVEFRRDDLVQELGERNSINRYLEEFYNETPQANISVPYFWWQGTKQVELPEEIKNTAEQDLAAVPVSLQQQVKAKVAELAGVEIDALGPNLRLANDLGLDSLTIMEIATWLESEFGTRIDDLAVLDSVEDCIMAAAGQLYHSEAVQHEPPPKKWFKEDAEILKVSGAQTLTGAFLDKALANPGKVILADRIAGVKTYRDILTAVFILQPVLKELKGQRVGVMLPASVSSSIVYLALLFAGKTPVMFNWTSGRVNMQHGIEETGVNYILSATPLCSRLEEQGLDLATLPVKWLQLDQVLPNLGKKAKLLGVAKSYLLPLFAGKLRRAEVGENAAILFTSGSESRPKSVPLSHENILTNLRDLSGVLELTGEHKLLGMLPPFHSLGLVGNIVLPLTMGIRTVYHANPTEPVIMADIIDQYKVSLALSTPTFLNGILQAGEPAQLESLRLAFTGAEKCPEHVRRNLYEMVPEAELCEGYGITECSPLVSLNLPGESQAGTIGRVLPSVEFAVVDEAQTREVEPGERGQLLVKGPSIFNGYLNNDNLKGFCEFDNSIWYQTGDFVSVNEDGHLVFKGRKKRFVKLAGEMISLPAIETTLFEMITAIDELDGLLENSGPRLAVEATTGDGHPEIVLFTTVGLKRQKVNAYLKQQGFSALHNIRRLIEIDEIPVLGTGKTDYTRLRSSLA
ncbi:MFS transporter [Desulfosediminicola ganghwensis]|uniref:MFS transporter n=1 Tax=Desulfosediminicola ganghwensis TaxID=2569540 RepID=UPI0010ABD3CF|nr:MFS transporter [Desulfosediminicola ganghwensis]